MKTVGQDSVIANIAFIPGSACRLPVAFATGSSLRDQKKWRMPIPYVLPDGFYISLSYEYTAYTSVRFDRE
jgi:hypothetical protein